MLTDAAYNVQRCYAAVLEVPDDDNRRLIYADSLDEAGDPNRAEFIRVQCELARLPPKPRELCVVDGAGAKMEELGVGLTPHGDGHYSVSSAERGLSIEAFAPNERVDIYAHLARKDRIGWMYGLKYVKHREDRHEIIFRKDAESGPWVGHPLSARSVELERAHRRAWLTVPCAKCGGAGWEGLRADGSVNYNCPNCNSTCDAGGLTWGFEYRDTPDDGTHEWLLEPVRVKFARGFPFRVTVPRLADAVDEVRLGDHFERLTYRTHRSSLWLAAVCRHHPLVTEVVCLDREPYEPAGMGGLWYWRRDCPNFSEPNASTIPSAVFARLPGVTDTVIVTHQPTRHDAVAALARAIVTFARPFPLT